MLTVVCVLVAGPYPYTIEYVMRLEAMARRWIRRPFTFICLTDRVRDVLGESIKRNQNVFAAPLTVGKHPADGYWGKVQLFAAARGFPGRVLYLDLDSLIVGELETVIDYPAPLALIADPPYAGKGTIDRYGRAIVRRFNSSVMAFDPHDPANLAIASSWTPAVCDRLSTDQDWIAEQRPDAAAMPEEWFPRFSLTAGEREKTGAWPADARVVLVKKPKNHEAARRYPWFGEAWG